MVIIEESNWVALVKYNYTVTYLKRIKVVHTTLFVSNLGENNPPMGFFCVYSKNNKRSKKWKYQKFTVIVNNQNGDVW